MTYNHIKKRRILMPKMKPKPSTKASTNQTATGNNNIQINANNVNLTIVNEGDTLRDSVKTEERK